VVYLKDEFPFGMANACGNNFALDKGGLRGIDGRSDAESR
jgi:hypothetical protein